MHKWGLENTVVMLFVGIFLSVIVLIYCEHMFKDDGQVFQVIAGLVSGFSGALFTKMKTGGDKAEGPPGTSIHTEITKIPKEDKPNV